MVYLIPIILITIGVLFYDYLQYKRGRIVLWILICLYLILLAGLRYHLGEDTLYYDEFYQRIPPLNHFSTSQLKGERFSIGFMVTASFFKMLTDEFTVFQLFVSIIINTAFFYFFYKNCKNIFFAALVYYIYSYIFMAFLQIREALSVSIILLAWPFFVQKKWLQWYLLTFFATFFHLSANIMYFLPLIYLPGVKNFFIFGKRTLFICIGVAVLGLIVQRFFFQYLQIFSFSEAIGERVDMYKDTFFAGQILNIKGIIATIIEYILYPIIALYFMRREGEKENYKTGFNPEKAMVLINTYITIFSIFIFIIQRFTNYFFPFVIVILSNWVFSLIPLNDKKIRLSFLTWFFIFLPMFALHSYSLAFSKINKSGSLRTYTLYYPYSSYFDKTRDSDREKAFRYVRRKKL
ncbi:MAG: EpsG family protein [Muribaculaceae bacterium]|nr:EpsG family protein [Muribaculaceae bacterium]